MKYIYIILIFFTISCSKKNDTFIINIQNVDLFFIEKTNAFNGCAGSNCNSRLEGVFKNTMYLNQIDILSESDIILLQKSNFNELNFSIISYYVMKKYRFKFILKDGRTLFSNWYNF